MNRRQKIIVSVTGIFLVLLLLVGLTYAYFLTNITGNTNNKSISVSTANLAVVYGGDDSSIIGDGETIIPGKTFAPKTFTVTNNGNATTDYVVVIEILEGTSTFESNDFTYTLTCKSGCNGVDEATTFPIEGGILVGNSIDVEETQTYAFTLTYEETGKNQTNDMNKTLNARINIKDIRTENPYKNNTELLSYNIINNAANGINGTKLRAIPLTVPGQEVSSTFYDNIMENMSISTEYQDYYWTYASEFEEDYGSADFKLSGITSCKYSECKDELVGKYLISNKANENSSSSSTELKITNENNNAIEIFEIVSTNNNSLKYNTITYDSYSSKVDETILTTTEDDYGTSYYFRGNVKNNYVNYSGMCWRIVRIQGDGTTKLVLADENGECNANTYSKSNTTSAFINNATRYKYSDYTNDIDTVFFEKSYYPNILNEWMNKSITRNGKTVKNLDRSKLVTTNWCNDTSIVDDDGYWKYYGATNRTYVFPNSVPTLKCNMNGLNNSSATQYQGEIGLLTADEIVFAGAFYQKRGYFYINDNSYDNWLTMTPAILDPNYKYATIFAFATEYLDWDGLIPDTVSEYVIRPAIVLSSNVTLDKSIIVQNGTQSNPYVIG